jgi:hypothetical protein
MYLQTPEFTLDIPACAGDMAVAMLVINSLAEGGGWVKIGVHGEEWLTQWSVLERNEAGTPTQFAYVEYDGTSGVISADLFS